MMIHYQEDSTSLQSTFEDTMLYATLSPYDFIKFVKPNLQNAILVTCSSVQQILPEFIVYLYLYHI